MGAMWVDTRESKSAPAVRARLPCHGATIRSTAETSRCFKRHRTTLKAWRCTPDISEQNEAAATRILMAWRPPQLRRHRELTLDLTPSNPRPSVVTAGSTKAERRHHRTFALWLALRAHSVASGRPSAATSFPWPNRRAHLSFPTPPL